MNKNKQNPNAKNGSDAGRLRVRAAVQAVIVITVASIVVFVLGHRIAGYVLYGVAALVWATGLLRPSWFHALERLGLRFGRLVGMILTWLLMVPFYYVFFTLGRLMLAAGGKDPMRKRLDPAAESYWTECEKTDRTQRYGKQYG